jgi:coenzyme F420-0:L-glutamate ligase/coenzyme F420-1:gamma-L-glutamate ligase
MSDPVNWIKERRSIRKYLRQDISLVTICELLDVARWAPSAHNAQPWRFIVLVDKPQKRDLAEAMANAWSTDMIKAGTPLATRKRLTKASIERFTAAPAIIVACLALQDMVKHQDESAQKSERDLAVQSLGAAIQNLLLAAAAKDIGACWFCAPIFCKDAVRNALAIPEEIEPQALITLGYPAEKPKAPARKPVHAYSYLNCWGRKL